MPTVYIPHAGVVVQEREKVNPPEPIPSSQPSNTIPPPSNDSQKSSVEKSKRVAKSDEISQPSRLRPSSATVKKMAQGRKRIAIAHTDKQAPLKIKKYIVVSSSDFDDEPLSLQLQMLKPTVGMKSTPDSTS